MGDVITGRFPAASPRQTHDQLEDLRVTAMVAALVASGGGLPRSITNDEILEYQGWTIHSSRSPLTGTWQLFARPPRTPTEQDTQS